MKAFLATDPHCSGRAPSHAHCPKPQLRRVGKRGSGKARAGADLRAKAESCGMCLRVKMKSHTNVSRVGSFAIRDLSTRAMPVRVGRISESTEQQLPVFLVGKIWLRILGHAEGKPALLG